MAKFPKVADLQGLSQDDATLVRKWINEAGEERFWAILAALKAPVGRPNELRERLPLLRAMGAMIKATGCTAHRAASQIARDKRRSLSSPPSEDSLQRWLRDNWKDHGRVILKDLEAPRTRSQPGASIMSNLAALQAIVDKAGLIQPTPELLRAVGVLPHLKHLLPEFALLQRVAEASSPGMQMIRTLNVLNRSK